MSSSRAGTFTNIFGQTFEGQAAFEKRYVDVLTSIFQGTTLELDLLKLRYLRPDVALADLETRVLGITKKLPPAFQVPLGVPLRTRLLLVLVRENDEWWIAGYHNVDVKSPSAT
jgi:uncharacterized protein (TIGR02246 family)